MGEARKDALKVGFDGSIRLEFHGATVSSDGGLLAYRDVDAALALTAPAGPPLSDWPAGGRTPRFWAVACEDGCECGGGRGVRRGHGP